MCADGNSDATLGSRNVSNDNAEPFSIRVPDDDDISLTKIWRPYVKSSLEDLNRWWFGNLIHVSQRCLEFR